MKRSINILLLLALVAGCKTDQTNATMDTASKNKATVNAFFKALENENAAEVAALFSENGQHINPYASGLFPDGAKGKEAIKNYWAPVFPNFDGM